MPASAEFLSDAFVNLVKDSRRAIRGVEALMRDPSLLGGPEVPIGIHQTRKLAAAYAIQVGQDEQVVKVKLGFSEVRILRKNYIANVPRLREACVLPGGAFIPNRDHEMSDSDLNSDSDWSKTQGVEAESRFTFR